MPYQILEARDNQKHEMVDEANSLGPASQLRRTELVGQRYDTETTLYRNTHCGLVVGATGKDKYLWIITS